MAEYQGYLKTHQGQRWAVVVGRFNQQVTDRLLEGALDQLIRHGVPAESVDVFWVPGALEIGGLIKRILRRRYAAIIALGAVIRGETAHFEYVAANASAAIAELARSSETPVIFGVLTCNTLEEAHDRADGKAGNKGADAALAAIEMADLYRQLAD